MTALRLCRLVPRYSLRTLAIFLCLATCAWGLWWHWEAWYCERIFEIANVVAIDGVTFTEEGDCILIDAGKPRKSYRPTLKKEILKYDVETGKLITAAAGSPD